MTNFAEHLQEALGTGYELERELLGGGMSRVFVARVTAALGALAYVAVYRGGLVSMLLETLRAGPE